MPGKGTPPATDFQDPAEVFEILSAHNGKPTGERASREQVHKQGLWHGSVHVWVWDPKNGQVLLQQRGFNKDTFPGRWDVSCAGHLDPEESARACAVRELAEELELAVRAAQPRFLYRRAREQKLTNGPYAGGFDREWTDIFLLELEGDQFPQKNTASDEVAGLRWIRPAEFRRELAEQPESFVPHGPDYREILDILERKSPRSDR